MGGYQHPEMNMHKANGTAAPTPPSQGPGISGEGSAEPQGNTLGPASCKTLNCHAHHTITLLPGTEEATAHIPATPRGRLALLLRERTLLWRPFTHSKWQQLPGDPAPAQEQNGRQRLGSAESQAAM